MHRTDRKIKVCFVSPKAYEIFNPEVGDYAGGAEVDLYHLATEIARDDNFEVSCVVADYGQNNVETIEGVTLIKSLDFNKGPFNGLIRTWQSLKQADADIYLIECASLGVLLVALFCRNHSRIFAYRTAHLHECDGTYLRKHFFIGRAFAWSLRRADLVVAQNATDVENLNKTIGISSHMIPNGHRLPPLGQLQRDTILWVGRDDPLKNPEGFLELAGAFPDEHFTMVCQSLTKDRHYADLIVQAGKIPNLQFIRHVPFNQIDSYFQRARVFVSTATAEGFPNTFINAAKCATPILSFAVNPDDFLDKYHCGLCAGGDWDSFVGMLRDMLVPENTQRYGANGRRYVEENQNITKITAMYKRIFQKLAGS